MKYFYRKVTQRKNRNRIRAVEHPNRDITQKDEEIQQIILPLYKEKFRADNLTIHPECFQNHHNTCMVDMVNNLETPFPIEEVIFVVKNLKSNASPGPDGIPTCFYQTYWHIVGEDTINTVLNILNNQEDPKRFNTTHINLIPKIKNPTKPTSFRPIA